MNRNNIKSQAKSLQKTAYSNNAHSNKNLHSTVSIKKPNKSKNHIN